MEKEKLYQLLTEEVLLLDGAMGTLLQQQGMPNGTCPERWILDNEQICRDIIKAYIDAGSRIIYTPTFGANGYKLAAYKIQGAAVSLNRQLAALAKGVAAEQVWVAGNISSSGRYVRPLGDADFNDMVNMYKQQVQGLIAGGVDLFVIETMIDIQEARAALLAVKESSSLPVCVSMTFDENNRTVTGTDPVTAVITLQNLGADVIGCNCSLGPQEMLPIVELMKEYAKVPLLVKPNAGLPTVVNGKTSYNLGIEEFVEYTKALLDAGANLIGGCCGTNHKYISALKQLVENSKPTAWQTKQGMIITSARNNVEIDFEQPLVIVGERINPTGKMGKKDLQQSLVNQDRSVIRKYAREQIAQGADVLDVNVGMSQIDQKQTIEWVIEELTNYDIPLAIDSVDTEVVEAALRIYPGRALVNSISWEQAKIDKMLKICKKYGSVFIALPLSDEGIPQSASAKLDIIEQLLEKGEEYGFTKEDILVDGLVMSVSTNQPAIRETLQVIQWCRKVDIKTIIGLSNVSFGLPQREWINAAFLAIAAERGLNMAIANPAHKSLINIKLAADVLCGNDANAMNYVAAFGRVKAKQAKQDFTGPGKQVYNAILQGEQERISELLEKAMETGITAKELVDNWLIPAITHVGDLFEQQQYFLPQLIMSANTVKQAFTVLDPLLAKQQKGLLPAKKKVVLATVYGDIHDIGKNLVALMLRNHGFEVVDLGKNVPAQSIIEHAQKIRADLIGLSALMTTTMFEMEKVIKLGKEQGLTCKYLIGGAAVTKEYAMDVGADGYAVDANEAVRVAKKLV